MGLPIKIGKVPYRKHFLIYHWHILEHLNSNLEPFMCRTQIDNKSTQTQTKTYFLVTKKNLAVGRGS